MRGWRDGGHPTVVRELLPVPMARQVQLVAGSLVLLGTLGAWLLTPWLLLLPGFIGAGLAFAGATGKCGMSRLLEKLPFNRPT